MNAVASHPREVRQLWRRQNSAPDVQRVDPNAYQDLNGDRQLEAPADSTGRPATARGGAYGANSAAPRDGQGRHEKALVSTGVKPSRSRHILVLDGQQAARFDSIPKTVAAISPGLLF